MLGAIRGLLEDERLDDMEQLLSRSLNDDAGIGKVSQLSDANEAVVVNIATITIEIRHPSHQYPRLRHPSKLQPNAGRRS